MLKRGGKNKKVPPMEFLMGVSHAQILNGYARTNNSVMYIIISIQEEGGMGKLDSREWIKLDSREWIKLDHFFHKVK